MDVFQANNLGSLRVYSTINQLLSIVELTHATFDCKPTKEVHISKMFDKLGMESIRLVSVFVFCFPVSVTDVI